MPVPALVSGGGDAAAVGVAVCQSRPDVPGRHGPARNPSRHAALAVGPRASLADSETESPSQRCTGGRANIAGRSARGLRVGIRARPCGDSDTNEFCLHFKIAAVGYNYPDSTGPARPPPAESSCCCCWPDVSGSSQTEPWHARRPSRCGTGLGCHGRGRHRRRRRRPGGLPKRSALKRAPSSAQLTRTMGPNRRSTDRPGPARRPAARATPSESAPPRAHAGYE